MLRKNEDWLDNKGQRRKGASGIDGMTVDEALPWLKENGGELLEKIRQGNTYTHHNK